MDKPIADGMVARPRPALRGLIAHYNGYRVWSAPGTHRGLPSPHLMFIITIDGTVDVAFGDEPVRPMTAMIGGLHGRPARIEHGEYQHGLMVAMTPAGARSLLGLPAGEVADGVVTMDAVLGRLAGELTDRVRSAGTWPDRFRALDDAFTRLAGSGPPPALAPELGWAWRRLRATAGRVDVRSLAAEVGWSRQHLRARFQREFGLTPKLAARVMRFDAASTLLMNPRGPSLAEVAVTCGYFDQAHLNRDWRQLAGTSPAAWLAEQLPFVQADAAGPELRLPA